MGFLRALGGYAVTAIGLGLVATLASSFMVLAMLDAVGAQIGAADAALLIGDDIAGFGWLYTIFIAAGLAVAFIAAALVTRLMRPLRPLIFTLAGGCAMAVMLVLMEQVFFGVQMVAGARTVAGFAIQVAAGALAGAIYAGLTPPPGGR